MFLTTRSNSFIFLLLTFIILIFIVVLFHNSPILNAGIILLFFFRLGTNTKMKFTDYTTYNVTPFSHSAHSDVSTGQDFLDGVDDFDVGKVCFDEAEVMCCDGVSVHLSIHGGSEKDWNMRIPST